MVVYKLANALDDYNWMQTVNDLLEKYPGLKVEKVGRGTSSNSLILQFSVPDEFDPSIVPDTWIL